MRVVVLRCGHALEAFEGGFFQRLSVAGVSHFDELVGALAQGLAEQVGDALLRHHVVDVSAGRHHARAWNIYIIR